MIDAFIELAEARAAWEEEYARTLSLLVQHDVLAAAVGGRRLPRPYPGLRLLAQRGPIAAVLSEPELPERLKEAIPREAQRYREEWLARLDLARRRWQSLEVPTRRAS